VAGGHETGQSTRTDLVHIVNEVDAANGSITPERGTTKAYTLSRLNREAPALFDRFVAFVPTMAITPCIKDMAPMLFTVRRQVLCDSLKLS